jgi:ubiquinone/menaquinone biosynthesis C-methylase UbiE
MTDSPTPSSESFAYEGYIIDAENAAEMARLMLQDHMLTEAMGGPFPEQEDLSQVHQILDIGCGPGGWLFEIVKQHPDIHGIGIDISELMVAYANSIAASEDLLQVQFRVMDATQGLQFPDNSFDLVNGRLLTGALLTQQWPYLLQECARITRSGGIIRWTEAEWGFTNSAAFDQLQCVMGYRALLRAGHSFSPHGRTVGTANVLRHLLQQAGYESIAYRAHALDYSAGTPFHKEYTQNCLVFHKLYQPFLVQMQVATQEELDFLYQQMEEDMQKEDFCAIDFFLTVWGRKPAAVSARK